MAWYHYFFNKNKVENKSVQPENSTYSNPGYYHNLQPIITVPFDGEKTPAELGPVRKILPDHTRLRLRSFEAELKSDVIKIITGKFFKWVVGSGLKIQVEPNEIVLKTEKVNVKLGDFRTNTENRFRLFCESKRSDYAMQQNLHRLAKDAFRTSFLGGDCLVVLRVENAELNVQVIDGEQVQTPFLDKNKWVEQAEARGNVIKHGIERNKRGHHIAYYVKVESKDKFYGEFERVEAVGERTGRKMAWMIYGIKHRIDHVRGIPATTSILEKVEKLDRYTEATVGAAEERAKIPFFIEHGKDSTGENPFKKQMVVAMGKQDNAASETEGYHAGAKTAMTIAASTSKQVFNLPIGSKLTALHSNVEIQYESFWNAVFTSIAASLDVPPEVALQAYKNNYSASRAAINGWEYIVKMYRKKVADDFYQPIYDLWLELEVLKNKIEAPQFIKLLSNQNHVAIQAYSKARFIGNNMPHIDPKKEIEAIMTVVEKKIVSMEQATEILNLGDWNENYKKIKEEQKIIGDGANQEQNGKQNQIVDRESQV